MAGLPTRSENALQQWHHLFESRGDDRSLQAQQHWQQLMRLGLPTRKHENWKYTPLDTLFSHRFVLPTNAALTAEQVASLALPLDAVRLVSSTADSTPASVTPGSTSLRCRSPARRSAVTWRRRFSRRCSCT
ncbi:hypothetical protein HA44_16415 [Mixta gaviniae]|nr:hypothetical protein HA44_16415 [Mixta gaviniae]